jgi:hypothetical protein
MRQGSEEGGRVGGPDLEGADVRIGRKRPGRIHTQRLVYWWSKEGDELEYVMCVRRSCWWLRWRRCADYHRHCCSRPCSGGVTKETSESRQNAIGAIVTVGPVALHGTTRRKSGVRILTNARVGRIVTGRYVRANTRGEWWRRRVRRWRWWRWAKCGVAKQARKSRINAISTIVTVGPVTLYVCCTWTTPTGPSVRTCCRSKRIAA